VVQGQLLAYAVLALRQGTDPTSYRRDMLAEVEVKAFHEGGIDLPAAGGEHLLHRLKRPKDHAVMDAHQAPAPRRLDHLDFLPFVKAKGEVFTSP